MGLPNVGKSTLFNALVETASAEASNYPFTTIEPNVGIVNVPDFRLDKLAEIEKSKRVVPATIKFVDIAGLVEGASKGEGLGNKFLSHIKEADAICMVVRCFANANITHVTGSVDPKRDIDIIMLELILSDLEQVTKALERGPSFAKATEGKANYLLRMEALKKMKEWLESENPLRECEEVNENDYQLVKDVQLITSKPMFFVANVAEDQLNKSPVELSMPENTVIVSARLETELKELEEEYRREYLSGLGVETRHVVSLQNIITVGYRILNLISFLTAGPIESRAWTIKNSSKAPQAAGTIHGDFEKKFIATDVVAYDKFVECGGWAGSREKGFVRTEGKEYIMKDGDVVVFKHG